ncbi:MAG: biotin transporter BioY [Longimicrobiaceae bacterium]
MNTSRESFARAASTGFFTSARTRRLAALLFFSAATAVAAKVALPLPGTPVPFTFQPLVVLLAGGLLGARFGAASQAVYLLAGAAGLPVFAAGGGAAYLLGPTGGYLVSYPVAAWVVGWICATAPGTSRALAGTLAGLAVIYLGGASWLAATGLPGRALATGVLPFLLADLVKALLAALATSRLRSRTSAWLGG